MIHLWDVSGTVSATVFGAVLGTAPEAALPAFAEACRFLPVSCAAYVLCWFLARLATSVATRFTLWLLYIASMAGYWLVGLVQLFCASQRHIAAPDALGSHPHWPMVSVVLSGRLASSIGSYLPVVLAAYLSVLAGLVLLGILRRRQLARALQFRLAPSPTVEQLFHEVAGELGIANCRLWLMPGLATPAAIHWFRPAVYLPTDCTDRTSDLENILRHELYHVRRRDNLWEAVARLCCGLLFFHPLLRRALASLRFEREVACDAEVVRSQPDTRDRYADTLVRFGWIAMQSRAGSADVFPGVRFASHAGILNARVRYILAGEPLHSRRSQRQRTLCGVAGLWVFAVTMPACRVGIDFIQSTAPVESIAAVATLRQQRPHHTIRAASRIVSARTNTLHASPTAAGLEPLLPGLAPAALPQVQYQSAHDEPQLAQSQPTANPADPDESSTGTASQHIPGRSRAKLSPSTVSVIVGAAIALGHLGLDHDHDRN